MIEASTGFRYLAEHLQCGVHVAGRCSSGSFAAAQEMFGRNRAGRSKLVQLFAPADQRAQLKALGLPWEWVVRFISLRLPEGKLEVLVTTLWDEQKYPTQDFWGLYHRRWSHETFYRMLKSRLDLENCSGKRVEAVRQDFHAAVLLCNWESLMTEPAQTVVKESLAQDQPPKQINRADAYHAMKDQLLELLSSATPAETVIQKLQCLFLGRPISVPLDRKVPRRKRSFHRGYHYQRQVKKIVF